MTKPEEGAPLRKGKFLLVLGLGLASMSALASTPASAAPSLGALKKDVLAAANVRALGFSKVLEPLRASSATGYKACSRGAEQVFQDSAGQTGLASEVLACTSEKTAGALLVKVRSLGPAVAVSLPKSLGSSATERSIGRATYAIYWRRGALVEVVALTTSLIAASGSGTTSTTVSAPLTAGQQTTLSNAALLQSELLR